MYTTFLTFRYLRRRLSAIPTLLAVTFGVATLFTVLSVMEGYRVRLRELIRGLESHITLRAIPPLTLTGVEEIEGVIRSVPLVAATAPFLETVAMYRSFGGFSHFQLKGIDPAKEAAVGDLERHLLRPEELARIFPPGEEEPAPRVELERRVQAVLGEDREPLSEEEVTRLFSRERRDEVLRAKAAERKGPPRVEGGEAAVPGALVVGINLLLDREVFLGDELKVVALSPDAGQPLTGTFLVVGAFKSGDFETDSRAALARQERIRTFLELWDPEAQDFRIEGIRIALHDYRHADQARRAIVTALADATAGEELPRLQEAALQASRLSPERIDSLAGELGQEIEKAGKQVDPEEVRSRVHEAARALGDPALGEAVRREMERAYREEVENLARKGISEDLILWAALRAAAAEWNAALLGTTTPPAPPDPREALRLAARRMVLNHATRTLLASTEARKKKPLIAEVLTWEERQQVPLQAVEREKWIVGFLVFLINAFVACIVLAMLVLLVIEKTRDIGILLALGAQPRGVVAVFLACGLCIITVGVGLGLLAGYFFVDNINVLHDAIYAATGHKLFDPEIYRLDQIPTTVSASEVVLSILPSLLFGLLASMVPAVWASRTDPIKSIHYE